SKRYEVVGLISKRTDIAHAMIADQKVYHLDSEDEFEQVVNNLSLRGVIFTRERDVAEEESHLVRFCSERGLKVLIAPAVDEVTGAPTHNLQVRNIKIEDLLGREEIKISMDAIQANFKDKVVMVTGAAGSIGSELCRQLAGFGVRKLLLFDNAETPMHTLRLELEERFPEQDFVPIIGDVRQLPRLDFAFRTHRPQVVFHAAAYKHVPLMEENPCEAVLVNVFGSHNVADKCIQYEVEKMVMISTDKAVNPTNIMGCTKRLAEIYVQSLGKAIEDGTVTGKTKFVTTRFGNVLGSNGSVIPRFREQIERGGPVTVTDPNITRYFMTIPEACRLVMEAATLPTENRICVFDMGKPVKIDDLARRMIELAGLVPGEDIEISYTGLRPGEKLYEEVLSNKENTDETSHDRIRIARVREYAYTDAVKAVDELAELSRQVDIPATVKLMKAIVPEYVSNNSRFEVYDRK
nr:polysaccharide biosynthesis protein [Bacteroidales bacterium]